MNNYIFDVHHLTVSGEVGLVKIERVSDLLVEHVMLEILASGVVEYNVYSGHVEAIPPGRILWIEDLTEEELVAPRGLREKMSIL
jgi:hypothetical protein